MEAIGSSIQSIPGSSYFSWLSFKVGTAAAIIFNGYHLYYDRFSPENFAIALVLEICSFMFAGIFLLHQRTELAAISQGMHRNISTIAFETAYLVNAMRTIEALSGFYSVFIETGFHKLKKKDIILISMSFLFLAYNVMGISRAVRLSMHEDGMIPSK